LRVATLEAERGPVAALAFSVDGRLLTSVGRDGSARLWNVQRASLVTTFPPYEAGTPSVTPLADGRTLLAWQDGRVQALAVPTDDL
jgi:WD40 repeat protein